MHPKFLDKCQSLALESAEKNDFVIISGDPDSGKSYLLRYILSNAVYKGKRTLYVVENDKEKARVMGMLKTLSFDRFIFSADWDESPQQGDINHIFQLLKPSSDPYTIKSAHDSKTHHQFLLDKIDGYYKLLNYPTAFKKPWHELVVLQAFDRFSSETKHFNQLVKPTGYTFEKEEYDELLEIVVRASDIFENKRANTDEIFSENTYEEDDPEIAWAKIETWIKKGRKKTSKVLYSIIHFLNNHKKYQTEIFLDFFYQIKKDIGKLKVESAKLGNFPVKERAEKGRSIFSGKTQGQKQYLEDKLKLITQLNELIIRINQGAQGFYINMDLKILNEGDSLKIINEQIAIIDDGLNELRSFLARFVQQKLDALNSNHTRDTDLEKLDSEINDLYEWINQNSCVKTHFESTAFSVNKKLQQLEEILSAFNDFLEKESSFKYYFEWNKFYRSLDIKAQALIDKLLIILPNSWVSFYRNWYVQNIIVLRGPLFKDNADEDLFKLEVSMKDVSEKNQEIDELRRINECQDWKSKSKKESGNLLKVLKSKKKNEVSWKELFHDYGELLEIAFPVVVVTEGNIASALESNYNLALIERNILDEGFSGMTKLFMNKGLKIVLAIDKQVLNSSQLEDSIFDGSEIQELKGSHLHNIIPMDKMNHTERLHAARNLAYLLMDIHEEIEVFHLGKDLIFSCLSKPLGSVFHKLLERRGIKKLRVLESPFHLLVESLLEVNTRRVLLTQDFLLNNNNTDNIEWQLFVRERLGRAGIEIVDFKTSDLLNNSLQNLIRFTDRHFPEHKEQVI